MKATIIKETNMKDLEWFRAMNPDYEVTGYLLNEDFGNDEEHTIVIFKGRKTLCGMCRDCGDHYIIARHSRYDRLDKNTLEYTFDVEDR